MGPAEVVVAFEEAVEEQCAEGRDVGQSAEEDHVVVGCVDHFAIEGDLGGQDQIPEGLNTGSEDCKHHLQVAEDPAGSLEGLHVAVVVRCNRRQSRLDRHLEKDRRVVVVAVGIHRIEGSAAAGVGSSMEEGGQEEGVVVGSCTATCSDLAC